MSYLIAIPSYDRVRILQEKTLALLERNGIPKDSITIFVADEEQLALYKAELPDYRFVVAVKGILNARNFITRYYSDSQRLVHIDDDLEEVFEKVNPDIKESKLMIPLRLLEFFEKAFEELESKGLSICGVNPVNNPYFLYEKVTTDLRYCIGCFRLAINRHDIVLQHSSQKEDVEQTLRAYVRDGGVLRYNHIAIKTRYYAKGGILSADCGDSLKKRKELSKSACELLAAEFPKYGNLKMRKNGTWEFALKRSPKVIQHQAELQDGEVGVGLVVSEEIGV
jgi:hypothetical protein